MFDPSIGRWLNPDPIGFDAGDPNLYRFVGNDPTNETDPSGLDPAKPEPFLASVGDVLGAAVTAVDDAINHPKPEDITWDFYQTVQKPPKNSLPGMRAFTASGGMDWKANGVKTDVAGLPGCGYVAKVTVNNITIRARLDIANSWFFDDQLNRLSDDDKKNLLAHERFHYKLAVLWAESATKRWNTVFGKNGVSGIGRGDTRAAAIAAAQANAKAAIDQHIKVIESFGQKLQAEYDKVAHVLDQNTGKWSITTASQESVESRVMRTLKDSTFLTPAFEQILKIR